MAGKTPEPTRFTLETRLSPGRAEFNAWVDAQVTLELRTALYSRNSQGREIAAGRAQVWLELQSLFTKP